MDENIVIEAMDSRFDGIDKFDVVDELLDFEVENKRLKEALRKIKNHDTHNLYGNLGNANRMSIIAGQALKGE